MSNIEFLRIWEGFVNSNEFKFLRSCELPPTTCRRHVAHHRCFMYDVMSPAFFAASFHMIPLFHGALYHISYDIYLLVDDEGFDAPILPFSETHSN